MKKHPRYQLFVLWARAFKGGSVGHVRAVGATAALRNNPTRWHRNVDSARGQRESHDFVYARSAEDAMNKTRVNQKLNIRAWQFAYFEESDEPKEEEK